MFIDEGAQAKTFIIFGRRTSTGSVPFFIWYALTLPNLSRQVSFLVCRWFVRRYGHVSCPRMQNVLFMLTCVSSKTSLLKLCCEVLNPESSNQSSPSMTSWKFRRTLQLNSADLCSSKLQKWLARAWVFVVYRIENLANRVKHEDEKGGFVCFVFDCLESLWTGSLFWERVKKSRGQERDLLLWQPLIIFRGGPTYS